MLGGLIGFGFCAGELAVGGLAPAPGQPLEVLDALWAVLGLGGLGALLGTVSRWLPWIVLGLVAGPHAARSAGVHEGWGWAGGAAFAAGGFLGPAGVLVATLGGALTSLARPRAGGLSLERPLMDSGPPIVLVTVDTLRADHGELPGLERHDAVSGAPWTLPAMYALMLGQPVRFHGGGLPVEAGYTAPDPALPSLAEALAAQGYRTDAVVSNPHLRAELDFDRGFDRFVHADDFVEPLLAVHTLSRWHARSTGRVERLRHRRDALVLAEATAALETPSERSRFLWVHLLGPHEYTRDPLREVEGWTPGSTDPDVMRRVYAANVDATLGRLAAWLPALPEDAVVAVTSDHGEALGPSFGHGTALDDDQLVVPLWTRGLVVPEGQIAAFDLREALLAAAAGDPAVRTRTVVEVGGLRRDASAFALRTPEGVYAERQPPEQLGVPRALGPELLEELRAVGYVD